MTNATSAPSSDAPPWHETAPRRVQDVTARPLTADGVCWVAAHGGAGASTLAKVLGGTDIGCRWPDSTLDEPARVLLVARTDTQGLRAAARAFNAVIDNRYPAGMGLLGLVLVADLPGRLPQTLRSRVRMLRSKAPMWQVPWIPQWRLGRQVDRLPKQLVKLGRVVQTTQRGGRR